MDQLQQYFYSKQYGAVCFTDRFHGQPSLQALPSHITVVGCSTRALTPAEKGELAIQIASRLNN